MVGYTTTNQGGPNVWGSAKIEIGPAATGEGGLINYGSCRNIEFGTDFKEFIETADNSDPIGQGYSSPSGSIKFEWLEYNLSKLATASGGLYDYSTTNGTPVTGVVQSITFVGTKGYTLNNKNADGSEVTITSFKDGSASPQDCVRNTDYVEYVNPSGYTSLARKTGGLIADGETCTVTYTYTPAATEVLGIGSAENTTPVMIKLTNSNTKVTGSNTKKSTSILFWNCMLSKGIGSKVQDDNDPKAWFIPMEFKATPTSDITVPTGQELCKITIG